MDGGAVTVGNAGTAAPWLVVCEHASNRFPARWGTLGLSAEAQLAHIAWDPGALAVAQALAQRLDAALVTATVSRLVYDLNRPPHSPGAMTERSEVYEIPGNRGLTPAERLERTQAVYVPFHAALAAQVARMLARGAPVLVTVHSFTPLWFGVPRAVELGLIHDQGAGFAEATLAAARRLPLKVALNEPYSAADGVTHTLKMHAVPYGLAHVMIEIRNDLIQTPRQQDEMADSLAGVLQEAAAAMARKGAA